MADSTIREPKTITLHAPFFYEEVLLLLKPRLPRSIQGDADEYFYKLYADVIESYLPELITSMGYSDDSEGQVRARERAVDRLRDSIALWRRVIDLPQATHGLVQAAYDEVLDNLERAHHEEFFENHRDFADEFKAWKRGA